MIEALHGRDGLGLGLVIDQFGSYLALSAVGIGAAALYAGDGPVQPRDMARKVMAFPPFIALLSAVVLSPLADHWLPPPGVLHPWPERRFAVTHPRWEPGA